MLTLFGFNTRWDPMDLRMCSYSLIRFLLYESNAGKYIKRREEVHY